MTKAKPDKNMADKNDEVVISRIFDAPRELVWKAWTDPKQLMQWYAPNGCTVSFPKLDLRVGGGFHSCIRTPEGYNCWCKGVYKEIIAPQKIVYTMAVADEKGNSAKPTDVGMDPEWPEETTVTVIFTEYEGKTKMVLHQTVSEALAKRTGAYPSWIQMMDRLDELVKAKN